MSTKNIQKLFASITHQSICLYMEKTGWSSMQRGDRLDFQKQLENSETPQTLYITAREDHPKFRSLVPNLIFSLSVLEEREAYSVAESIHRVVQEMRRPDGTPSSGSVASVSAEPTSPTRSDRERSRWIRIRNGTSSSIEVAWGEQRNSARLPGGETLLVDPSDFELGFEVQGDVRIFGAPKREGLRIRPLLDLPGRRISSPKLVEQQILRILHSQRDTTDSALPESFDAPQNEWLGLVHRFFFANGVHDSGKVALPTREATGQLLRSLSMLLADLSERLDSTEGHWKGEHSSSLFEISRWLLAMWGITFTADPDAPFQLCTALLSDRGTTPIQTLEWLEANCESIAGVDIDTSLP
ncbi:hypothetical protein [Pirellula sp. SH-Sr6A]|uniref:hypothetical protein n=1 Tax=Pirellula sp. SH-Sr6A TaxID=1632865 RepID=UPI0011BA9768|nr:hypothetical protein [Pirellula sp. SH-Sr6A]